MSSKFSTYKIYAELANDAYNYRENGDIVKINNTEYTIVFQRILSSFQATLYKSESGENIIAVCGTDAELSFNGAGDILNDILLATIGTNWQSSDLQKFYLDCLTTGLLSLTDKLNVTGRSLGGYLAQIFTLKNVEAINNTYTFNAPGLLGSKGTILNALGISNMRSDKIIDVEAKDGFSLIAGTGLNAGQEIEVSGESHSIIALTKILYFYDSMVKNGAGEEAVTDYLSGSYKSSSTLFKGGVADIAEQTMQKIDKIINKAINKTDIIDICQAYEDSTNNINFNIQLINPDSTIPNSNSSIENLYALINLNPFIVSGVSSKAYTELEKHKDEYSDEYVQDCKLAS